MWSMAFYELRGTIFIMANVIATVKLAPGNVAFYDEYSKIHLTLSNPIAKVYEGMDLRRIRASVKSGTLRVLSGSLPSPVIKETKVHVATQVSAKVTEKKVVEAPVAKEEIPVATKEPVEEPESVACDVQAEEVVVEKKTTKRSKKSSQKDSEQEPVVEPDSEAEPVQE